jgi:hypothetical protein
MNSYFNRMQSAKCSPLCKRGAGGDLRTAGFLQAYKSPSLPLWKSGMTPLNVRLQTIGEGSAA